MTNYPSIYTSTISCYGNYVITRDEYDVRVDFRNDVCRKRNEWMADLLRGNTPTAEWEEKNFIPDIFDESLA